MRFFRLFSTFYHKIDDHVFQENQKNMKNEISNSHILKKICNQKKLLKEFNKLNFRDQWLYYNVAVWERVYKVKIRN